METADRRSPPGVRATWAGRARVVLLAAAVLAAGGCTAITIAGMVKDAAITASVTATGNHAAFLTLDKELGRRFGVQTEIQTVRTGVRIVKIIGTYIAVVDALNWMAVQGIQLVANNVGTEAILEVAIALIK